MSKKKASDEYYENLRMKGSKMKKELNNKFKELLKRSADHIAEKYSESKSISAKGDNKSEKLDTKEE
jgi:hypothetical protein